MPRLIDLTGQRFGRLVVVERVENSADGRARWLCRCDCGQSKTVLGEHLKKGRTKSCGCAKSESSSKRFKKHGGRNSKLYRIWSNMKDRCNNPDCKVYSDYGGRGIKVCKEWIDDFSAFQKWALANGYKEGLTIDHKDNDKGYSPDNCRWTDRKIQGNNKRNCRYITYKGQRKTVAEWSDITGIPHDTLLYRLNHGWETERILKK